MRRFILSVLALSLIVGILAGCTNQNSEAPNEKSNQPTNQKSLIPSPSSAPEETYIPTLEILDDPYSIHLVECQFYGDSIKNLDYKEAWPQIVENHYGVKITMTHPQRNGYMGTIHQAAMSGDLTGIVELFGGPYLIEWKAADLIHPLSDFLKNNETWNTIIPELWKEEYTIDGEVWAIPAGSDGAISWHTRSIRGDWLDKFGLNKPYTIDEFYEASYKFTYDDPNGSQFSDTVGFTASGIFNLQDIFQAFDARLNQSGEAKPTWNPNDDIWEDSLIKPEMVDCLEFLRKCFSEGVLDPQCFSEMSGAELREKVSSGLYGGTFYWDSWVLSFETRVKKLVPESYFHCVGALSNTIDKNLNHYMAVGIGAPKVMMKTTSQPKETINWYVNTFFGDEWGFWTGRLGPVGEYRGHEGRALTIEDNIIVRNTFIDHTGTIKTYPGPGFIGGLPTKALYSIYEVAYYVPEPPEGFENWAVETAQMAMDNTARRKAWLDEYIENGMVYSIPNSLLESNTHNYSSIGDAGLAAIENAITGEMSISSALEQYRTIAKSLGAKAILDQKNEKIGKTTLQDY